DGATATQADARVVDEHVEALLLLAVFGEHASYGRRVRDVDREPRAAANDLLALGRYGSCRRLVEVSRKHDRPLFGDAAANRCAKSRSATGDQCDLPLQAIRHTST